MISSLVASANDAVSPNVHPVLQQSLPPVSLDGWNATAVEVSYPPGGASKPHRHPGFVLGYVLEGEVRFQLKGEKEVTYRAGQMFYEPPGSVHMVSSNAGPAEPAKLLAIVFSEKGSPVTIPL